LQGHKNNKERVAVEARASQEKSQAHVSYHANEQKNAERGNTDASEKEKTDD